MVKTLALAVALAGLLPAQEKQELRTRFEKGEKVTLDLKYGVKVKFDKVPEVLQGAIGEDFLDLKMEGLLGGEVSKVEAGKSTVDGKWKTFRAKGHAMAEEVDLKYDAEKKDDLKVPKKDNPDESTLNIQQRLVDMVAAGIAFDVDALGRTTLSGEKAEVAQQFIALNGMMGALPEGKVGKGDTWKGEWKLEIPMGTVKIPLSIWSENTYASDEGGVAVIQSKLRVGAKDGDGEIEVEIDPGSGLKMKMKGEGEAKTLFSVKEGRPTKSENKLKVRFTSILNLGGGDDIKIEGTMTIEESHAIGK